ncbi:DUF1643 domain-containing protein [Sinorhizobium meliloti]|nr:DUF1643 domain-containing protein [Sinorhizobium meliloti]
MITFNETTPNSKDRHDPGGKVRIRLRTSIRAGATFSDCGRYRPLLWRDWDGAPNPGHVLWIGMNPSTADGDVDDPTVRRECDFTAAWGYGIYRKCNVMDFRATQPKALLQPGISPRSDINLSIIVEQARSAQLVILAFGSLHRKLSSFGTDVVAALETENIDATCLGFTANGSPRHPLYLRKDAERVPFPRLANNA